MDKELLVLCTVSNTPEASQRELAHMTGLSLGSINILIKKMIKEGLIKLEKLPAERVAYMLTPRGADEKIAKTKKYICLHYAALEKMRAQLTEMLLEIKKKQKKVCFRIEQTELLELSLQISRSIGLEIVVPSIETDTDIVILHDNYLAGYLDIQRECINVHDYLTV